MKAKELAEEILKQIEQGTLDQNAVVVRPFCQCDENVGYIEAQYLDQVIRKWEAAEGIEPGKKIYKFGNAELTHKSSITLKLG